MDLLQQLSLAGIVPVIRVDDARDAVPLCRALSNGGLPVAEITFRSDAAEEAIRLVHEQLPQVILGAGTVISTEQVDRAEAAGARYIVSPGFDPDIVRHCQKKGLPIVPGCGNASDIERAIGMGITTVKFFPAEALGGLRLIKALAGPFYQVRFLPTGGIGEHNLNDYLACDRVVACGGSWMVPSDAVQNKDWARIEGLTRSAVSAMLGLELQHIGINSGTEERSRRDAEAIASLLGWPIHEKVKANFVGEAFEVMKIPFRGEKGHVALACNNVERAKWHLEQRGFAFDDSSAGRGEDGKLQLIYLKGDIAGFAFHLLQK